MNQITCDSMADVMERRINQIPSAFGRKFAEQIDAAVKRIVATHDDPTTVTFRPRLFDALGERKPSVIYALEGQEYPAVRRVVGDTTYYSYYGLHWVSEAESHEADPESRKGYFSIHARYHGE